MFLGFDNETWTAVGTVAGALAGLIPLGIAGYVWISKWRAKKVKAYEERQKLESEEKTKREEFYKSVMAIRKELIPNGGSSIKDQLNRLETSVTRMRFQQAAKLEFDSSPIFISDENGEIIFVNKALITIMDKPREDLLGRNWLNCVDQAHREQVRDDWKFAVDQKSNIDLTFKIMAIDNMRKPVLVEIRCMALYEPGCGFFGVMRDASYCKRTGDCPFVGRSVPISGTVATANSPASCNS